MMYLPSIFGDDMFDRWMSDFDRDFYGKKNRTANFNGLMKSDVRENENGYELDVELPGFRKEDVQLTLEKGVLNIAVAKNETSEEKDEKTGKLIRQERYSGSMNRSFYVGDNLSEDDITAKMENGVLTLKLPKKGPKLPEKKTIAITD